NRLNRRFDTSIPLQKIVTDITEFKCLNDEKLYLNPLLDLYNGEILTFGISKKPTLDLVLNPLNNAIKIINSEAKYRTTIHSEQGKKGYMCRQYRHGKLLRYFKARNLLW